MTGHLVSHLVRRGLHHASEHFSLEHGHGHGHGHDHFDHHQHGAEMYEKSGQEIHPTELLPMLITALVAFLLIWSIDYTVGQVISSLAMIESPSATAIIDSKPPAYADVPDAPREKEPLLPSEAEADVEVTVINHVPITAKIVTTIGHLHRIGGFAARWRGLSLALLYHLLHASFTNLIASFLHLGLLPGFVGEAAAYTFASVALCRVHMAWTQKMITYPSTEWWWRRLPSRKETKALILPSFAYAIAEQATVALPIGVAILLGLVGPEPQSIYDGGEHGFCPRAFMLAALKFLAVPATYAAVAFLVLLPASVTLTRIEAALLPAGEETIVPFDRAAVIGDSDLTVRRGRRALFVDAWRSFDRASRWRLIKLYVKMFVAQATIAIVAFHLVFAELYMLGPQRIVAFVKSTSVQVKHMAHEAHEAHEHAY